MIVIYRCYLRRVLKISKQSETINVYRVAILKACQSFVQTQTGRSVKY